MNGGYICFFDNPEDVRRRAKEVLEMFKDIEDNHPPMKTLIEKDGEIRLAYSINAIRQLSKALINASDEAILITRGMDISEVMDMFVFYQ